ncbi:hypothetical protein Verru16b_02645 [Lacunisphaera limnophila]|uniref:Uncharacterized protein n=1 Tax=Lacunisphaera limnophila TaxID=1838286 RepID=A0A1D8AXD9_9BACT|nr:Amuc_1100 family pilus-like protein [Lacunisphaera limnophila]AOS45562.1 hypothetical protein Verru16b_02645 [Lacunisphaera limnophila]
MNRLRPHFLLFAVLLALVVVAMEAWLLQHYRGEAARAQAAFEQIKQERDWLARQSPAPTPENEAAIAAELEKVRRKLADLREELRPRAPDSLDGPPPGKSMDAYFALAGLVEQGRAQAITTRVSLRPDEYFGFATYAHEGPADDLLGPVHRQKNAVRRLLEPLFESRPLAVLGVQRTAPAAASPDGRSGADDFFIMDPGLSLREAGLVDTEPVRLEFTGQTSTLRTFLTGLATLPHPVVVRSIEVEPLPPTGSVRPVAADAPQPVVRQSLSKFAVIVEFVLLTSGAVNPAP